MIDLISGPTELLATHCDVWFGAIGGDMDELVALLTAGERQRLERFHFRLDADRFTLRRALTQLILAQYLGTTHDKVVISRECNHCDNDGHGKPHVIADTNVSFSVSSRGNAVVVAVAAGVEIGVDIEVMGRSNHRSASLERAVLGRRKFPEHAYDERGVLSIWTQKEAVLKAFGLGLAADPDKVVVAEPGEPAGLHHAPELTTDPKAVSLVDLPLPEPYVGHLACIGSPRSVRLIDVDLDSNAKLLAM